MNDYERDQLMAQIQHLNAIMAESSRMYAHEIEDYKRLLWAAAESTPDGVLKVRDVAMAAWSQRDSRLECKQDSENRWWMIRAVRETVSR